MTTKPNEVRVEYTDGEVVFYESVKSAQEGIIETITGCDFAVAVQSVVIMGPPECESLGCEWSVKLVEI